MKQPKLIPKKLIDKQLAQRDSLIGYHGLKLETEFLLISGRTDTYRFKLGKCGKEMLIQDIEYQPDLEEDGKHYAVFELTLADYLEKDIESHFIGYIIIE